MSRAEFLRRVADTYDDWETTNAGTSSFDPDARPSSGDANVWDIEMSATPEQHDALHSAIGERDSGEVDDDAEVQDDGDDTLPLDDDE